MPELPEVETIRRRLAPSLAGRRLREVEILDPRWTRPVAPGLLARELHGALVERLSRFGKYLVWELDRDRHLLLHLRMTGALLLDPAGEPLHTRARFTLDDGHRLRYVDPRRFGTAELLRGRAARDAYLSARLGPEPLTPAFGAGHLLREARGRSAPVKAFLLDQRRVAGVGNIYADEALFRAGIHPLRAAGRLTRSQMESLAEGIEQALAAGIAAQGATIDDFRHPDGSRGAFQDEFLVHLRAGRACGRCGGTVAKLVVAGRGTYVCETCQPRPRGPRRTPARGAGTPRREASGREQ